MARQQGTYKPLPPDGDPKINGFKQRLRDAIQDSGLTYTEVAKAGTIPISPSRISEAVNGYDVPTELTVKVIAQACHLPEAEWLDEREELSRHDRDRKRTGWQSLPLETGLHPYLRAFLAELRAELARSKITLDEVKQRSGFSDSTLSDALVGVKAPRGYIVMSIAHAAGFDAMAWHGKFRRALTQARGDGSEGWPPAIYIGPPRFQHFGPSRRDDIGVPAGMILNEWDVHAWTFRSLPGTPASLDLAVHVAWWRLVQLADYVVTMLGASPVPSLARGMWEMPGMNIYSQYTARSLAGHTPAAIVIPLAEPQFTGLQEWKQLAERFQELQDLGDRTLECLVHGIHPEIDADEATAYLEKTRSAVDFMRILLEATAEAHGELSGDARRDEKPSKQSTSAVQRDLAQRLGPPDPEVRRKRSWPWQRKTTG
ncbi:helix-turn-helix domain-containing protein [Streptomyces sp. NPDC002596]|uniref:helix-turn-helix domain-containing protein n=1 Tax=Streptomyces sp. NPDC057582 TaxID=3346174 RepID=UPI0036AC1901